MKNFNPKEQWNNIGIEYDKIWKGRARKEMEKKELNFINEYINKDSRKVIDIGIGCGRILGNYVSNDLINEIYGIDIAEKMVEICKKKFKNDDKIKSIGICDISKDNIPYHTEFDFISAIRVLKYNRNWKEIIEKISNQLSPNGIFVFTMPNKYSINNFSACFNKFILKNNNYDICRTSGKEIQRVCKGLNLKLIKIISFSKIPDIFYDFSDNYIYVKLLMLSENILERIFGRVFLGRQLFICVKNTKKK